MKQTNKQEKKHRKKKKRKKERKKLKLQTEKVKKERGNLPQAPVEEKLTF